ncbi:MAG: helix-turn-helix transcriptional regulator [Acidimicrobiia bacterium]|jgi:DNA-binding CsgD family transcriptional regulator
MAVDERDIRTLSEAIFLSREAESVESFPALALEITTLVVRNDLAGWNEVDPQRPSTRAVMFPPVEITAEQHATLRALMQEHPLIHYVATTGDGSAMKVSDFITSDEFHARRVYRELFAGLGMEHQMAIGLPAVLPRITAIALNRNVLGDDFDERDRLLLNTLRPHLAQSYEQIRERERMQHRLGTLTGALEEGGTHVIALETQPSEVTPGALVLLYRFFGRPGARDPFPARLARWLETQRRAVHTPAGEMPKPLAPVTAERGGTRLVVRYLPATPTSHEALLLDERSTPVRASELERLGLTRREAEVLQLLGTGATNASLAATLHVSPATVKTHLENVYRKLGASGRAQAVAMALTLLPGSRADGDGGEIGRSAD